VTTAAVGSAWRGRPLVVFCAFRPLDVRFLPKTASVRVRKMADASTFRQPTPERATMHTEHIQSAQGSSSRAAAESAAMARASRAPAFHRPSLKVRATAALVAVVLSSTTLGTVMALYGSPDSAVLIARAAEPAGEDEPTGPRSQIPTRPCVAGSWVFCA